MQPDLNAAAVFALVAEERSFRAAADRLGVTRSAISQTMRRLEESLGTALLRRTTRSVSLTEAGERLYAQIAPAIAEVRSAIEDTGNSDGRPRGRLRLACASWLDQSRSGRMSVYLMAAEPAPFATREPPQRVLHAPDFVPRRHAEPVLVHAAHGTGHGR